MAAFEVIALDTATPQLRAPGASDTYTFPRAVEMPLGTANGVLYLNGSKVATSGSALTFDGSTFAVNSAASIGSNTAKTKFYSDSTYNGIFNGASLTAAESIYMGAGGLFFFTSGSERMRLTSTGLGIGTSSPGYKLDVQGDVRINGGNQLRFFRPDNSTQGLSIYSGASNNFIQAPVGAIIVDGTNSITFDVTGAVTWRNSGGASERMRLDSSGNLGLGVTPKAWTVRALELIGSPSLSSVSGTDLTYNAYYDGAWKYTATAVATRYAQIASTGAHAWFTAPSGTAGNAISFTQAMTLDASGNLGVGTTSPGATLELARTSADVGLYITRSSTGAASYRQFIDGDGDIRLNMVSSKNMRFFTVDTERARITSGGSLVVGTAALATSATDGFLYVPTCAGTPTGTPTTQTGTAPIVVDTTNNKLYFYSGGQWRDAGP